MRHTTGIAEVLFRQEGNPAPCSESPLARVGGLGACAAPFEHGDFFRIVFFCTDSRTTLWRLAAGFARTPNPPMRTQEVRLYHRCFRRVTSAKAGPCSCPEGC